MVNCFFVVLKKNYKKIKYFGLMVLLMIGLIYGVNKVIEMFLNYI